jgi:hypothetical protein
VDVIFYLTESTIYFIIALIVGYVIAVTMFDIYKKAMGGVKESAISYDHNGLMNSTIEIINSYPHKREYPNEHYYHHMLYGYMQNHFNDIVIEEKIRESRPDITINNTEIAIEVKGPTSSSDLESIYYIKCKKYPQIYKNMIVVLFDVKTKDSTYNNWYKNMRRDFPKVPIIRKELNS